MKRMVKRLIEENSIKTPEGGSSDTFVGLHLCKELMGGLDKAYGHIVKTFKNEEFEHLRASNEIKLDDSGVWNFADEGRREPNI